MHKFKELKVWQKSIDLAVSVYGITKSFPKEEQYGLTSQVTRCAVSVPSNIAEGAGRNTKGEFKQFLGYSSGSINELETQLIIANKVKLLNNQPFEAISTEIQEIRAMINRLILTQTK